MPYSKQTFSYTTGARTFTLALASGYDYESNISVYVEGELDGGNEQIFRDFTFDSEFVINVTDALDNPSSVVVLRTVSPTVFSVDFEAGADVTKRNLQLAFRQQFFLMQELLDGRVDGVDLTQSVTDAETAATSALASAASAAASAASIDVDDLVRKDGTTAFTDTQTGVAPTSDLHLATKKYVDDSAGGGGVMLLDGSQQMSAAMLLVNAAPTLGNHATRKTYVDTGLALKANLSGGATFTGTIVVPNQSADDDSTKAANTSYVDDAVALVAGVTPASVQNASGASITFGSIPAGTERITLIYEGVRQNGGNNFLVQIGDAGGIESSAYVSNCANRAGGNTETSAFMVSRQGGDHIYNGHVVLTRIDGDKAWTQSGVLSRDAAVDTSGGHKTLSDTLTQVKLLLEGGQVYDLGRVNIFYG